MTDDERPRRIEQLEEVLAYGVEENPWVKVYFDRVRFPDGTVGHYNRIIEGTGLPGVVILPTDGKLIGLVRVFRYPIGGFSIELPRGFGEAEDPATDAARELAEETGWRATSYHSLGLVHANSGLIDGHVELFVARIGSWSTTGPTDTEADAHFTLPVSEVFRLAATSEITDALTISCLFRASHTGVFENDAAMKGDHDT